MKNSSSTLPISSLDPDIRIDLKQRLEVNFEQIICQYGSYVNCILTSIQAKRISVNNLRSYLVSISAFQSGLYKEECKLLSAVKLELEKATTINEIFDLLNWNCASFFNYRIFQFLVNEYDIKDTRNRLKYPEYLKEYVDKHKISEFIEINPALEKVKDGSSKLVLKFDIELTCKVARIDDLRIAVAKILGLRASTLRLLSIEEGCVVVTFLIPCVVADVVFSSKKKFSTEDIEEFRASSVLWLECNGCRYDFSRTKTTGNQYTCTYYYIVALSAHRPKHVFLHIYGCSV